MKKDVIHKDKHDCFINSSQPLKCDIYGCVLSRPCSGIEKIDVPLGTEQSNIIACFVKGDKTNDQAGARWTVYRENILLNDPW